MSRAEVARAICRTWQGHAGIDNWSECADAAIAAMATDPLAAAERAVVDKAVGWATYGGHNAQAEDNLHRAIGELLRLRAAQAGEGGGT